MLNYKKIKRVSKIIYSIQKVLGNNKTLFAILSLSFLLNCIGLYPNTLLHQDEPGLLIPARTIFTNIIFNFNFDPNVEPFPFKYGSSMYYLHAIIQGIVMLLLYSLDAITTILHPRVSTFNVYQYVTSDVYTRYGEFLLIVGRFITVIFGTMTVYLTYKIAKKLELHKATPLYAALTLATMPLFVRDSHYATVDIPQVFFIMLAFYYSIDVWEKKSLRSYVIAGILVGYSASIKYFPLALLPFLFFHFLGDKKFVSQKLLLAFISMFLGYLIGMPYFIYHFHTIISQYKSISEWFTPVYIPTRKTFFEKLLPPYGHIYFYTFLFKEAVLPIPLFISLFGFLYGLIKKSIPVISLTIIPLVDLIFITFFLRQEYERLLIPCLPFLAIFIGIGIQKIIDMAIKDNKKKATGIIIIVISITFSAPLINSLLASISCATDIPEYQANPYIINNIPPKTIFGFNPGMRLPDTQNIWHESTFKSSFSLAELQEHHVQFLAHNSGYLDSFLLWPNDLLFPSKYVIDNQYVQLALTEINQRAKHLKTISRPYMCVGNVIHIYELPKRLSPAKKLVTEFLFDIKDPQWSLKLNPTYSQTKMRWTNTVGHTNKGLLEYSYKNPSPNLLREDTSYSYADPIFSPFIKATGSKKYTADAYVLEKIQSAPHTKDGFLRLDFYSQDKQLLHTALSPRVSTSKWQKLSVTAVAPPSSHYLRIGFQGTGDNKAGLFLLDDIKLYSE